MSSLQDGTSLSAQSGGAKGRKAKQKSTATDIFKIVKMIMDRAYHPVIIFSFSKKECEIYALQMSKLDFNTEDEKKMVDDVFQNAIDNLAEDEQKLPQVEHIRPLLRRGIGMFICCMLYHSHTKFVRFNSNNRDLRKKKKLFI